MIRFKVYCLVMQIWLLRKIEGILLLSARRAGVKLVKEKWPKAPIHDPITDIDIEMLIAWYGSGTISHSIAGAIHQKLYYYGFWMRHLKKQVGGR